MYICTHIYTHIAPNTWLGYLNSMGAATARGFRVYSPPQYIASRRNICCANPMHMVTNRHTNICAVQICKCNSMQYYLSGNHDPHTHTRRRSSMDLTKYLGRGSVSNKDDSGESGKLFMFKLEESLAVCTDEPAHTRVVCELRWNAMYIYTAL